MQLTKEQLSAVEEIEHNLQIIACAGSGKTEVITRRISHILKNKPEISPAQIVAFTFTEKAAESMKARIQKNLGEIGAAQANGMYVGTIHSFCWNLLNRYVEKYRDYKILDTVKSHLFVERYHTECGMDDLNLSVNWHNIPLFLTCIEKMIDDYDNRAQWTEVQRETLDNYIACLEKHNYIDFSLLIFQTIQEIKENDILKKELSDIKYLIVDEYQDVDDLQEKIIQLISSFGANVCVVGDDDQTIYQFRGSNADNMITFSDRYLDVKQVRLEKNFRCEKSIVDIADTVISQNQNRLSKKMIPRDDASAGNVFADRYETEEYYQSIAERISNLHDQGIPYNEIAILFRKGKFVKKMEQALYAKGIPVSADSAERFFCGTYFVCFKDTIEALKEKDRSIITSIWDKYVEFSKLRQGVRKLCAYSGQVYRISEILLDFCADIDFLNDNYDDVFERKNTLDGMVKILDDYDEIFHDRQVSARIDGLIRFLENRAMNEYKYHNFAEDNKNDSVQIMTVHKSKGLEFHTVFLPELQDKQFPVGNVGGKKYWSVLGGAFEENKDVYRTSLEDERKLFYVAVTRAKKNLYLSYDLSKNQISVFLKEATESMYLSVDETDLVYNPKEKDRDLFGEYNDDFCDASDEKKKAKEQRDVERAQRKQYWEAVKYARDQLYDYYGTAAHFCKGAYGDLMNIKNMKPDEIIREATKMGLM